MPPLDIEANSSAGDVSTPAVPTRRRWLSLLILFCMGGFSAAVARNYLFSKPSAGATEQAGIVESLPKPSLAPEDVVREQVDSMRASTTNPDALVKCFSFASPSNRKLTGPFERFAKLVNTEPYRQISVCLEYQIGRAIVDGNSAGVLVSILAEDGSGLAFQFLLAKQSEPPYRDCWMTDGVFPLLPLGSDPSPIEPLSENPLNDSQLPTDRNQPLDGEADKL